MTACPSTHFARPFRGPLVVALVAMALAACSDRSGPSAAETAARVNNEAITVHQINYVLQQQRGLDKGQVDSVARVILERLIDQQLALQRADEKKLDNDPKVLQQLEVARREIIARAYLETIGEAAPKPTAEEVKKYYDDKPALFKERRIYSIQEITIEATPEQVPTLREKLEAAKGVGEFIEYLQANDFKFVGNQALRAAEQLPLQNLESFARMKDGQAAIGPAPNGVQVVVLAGSRSQPVTEEQARPAIEAFLLNERKRKLVAEEIKSLRGKAKIEYVGRFVPGSGVLPADQPAQPGSLAPASAASGAPSSDEIGKGLGLSK